jgi:hypothetical protein
MSFNFTESLHYRRYNLIVLMKGRRKGNRRFFAYVEIAHREYQRILYNPELFTEPAKHGKVLLEGDNDPTDTNKAWMESEYGFKHSPV